MNALTTTETEAILTLCLIASFADGDKHDRERQQLKKITDSLAGGEADVTALYQQVLLNKPDVAAVAARLLTPGVALPHVVTVQLFSKIRLINECLPRTVEAVAPDVLESDDPHPRIDVVFRHPNGPSHLSSVTLPRDVVVQCAGTSPSHSTPLSL